VGENTDVEFRDGGPTVPTAYMLADASGRQLDVHVLDDYLTPLWTTERAFVGARSKRKAPSTASM